jgi:hypothetical protein
MTTQTSNSMRHRIKKMGHFKGNLKISKGA